MRGRIFEGLGGGISRRGRIFEGFPGDLCGVKGTLGSFLDTPGK